MKPELTIDENIEQLDELSWQDVKTGAANTLGAIGKGIGGVASVPQGIARAVKAGYKSGVDAIGGPADGQAEPAAQGQAAPAGQAAPGGATGGAAQASSATAGIESQIKQKEQELTALKSQLQQAKAAPAPAPAGKNMATKAGDAVAGAFKDAEAAMKAGVGGGVGGHSLMQTGSQPADSVNIKDAQGIEHGYRKVGQQWVDKDNKPVNAAQAAMLDKQAQQQAALSKDAAKPAAQEPVKIGGQTLDPSNPADKKIIDQVQKQQGGTQQPAAQVQPGAADPRDLNKDGTVDATEKSIARNKAKTGSTPPQAATAAPATAGQSPEEIRKAKQATATKTAQDQMAANPAPAKQPAAVWKNNRNPAAPAGTSPADAAAKAQQPAAKAAPNDVMARMAKQLAPAPAAAPNFAQPGYASVKMNAPTAAVPQQPAVQPTTGAQAVPVQQPAQGTSYEVGSKPAADSTTQDATKAALDARRAAGVMAESQTQVDFSAALARKVKIRL